jgi:hypothetical protein
MLGQVLDNPLGERLDLRSVVHEDQIGDIPWRLSRD